MSVRIALLVALAAVMIGGLEGKSQESMKHKFHAVRAKHEARKREAAQKSLKNSVSSGAHHKTTAMIQANSMSPHLEMHATRGQLAGGAHRHKKASRGRDYQKTLHGEQKLPPDEATPFFELYVLKWAFPTIALICSCLGCILYRTMRMYQKERWKGTSYFHGARRSAESLIPGVK
eukprot:CAMPEP_0184296118 /NCGR_PEP_ID=MMETSP1049-20130417/7085_1 /TAXON_ID=77928 /ORGANISM="Proteomonas sulcata, Strain CCMP704" /LENGTH=175 /DNA_ID=CAMNT_0026605145 /DNA_START=12 /DNA_END=539 /DNA_ORIENTATION=+